MINKEQVDLVEGTSGISGYNEQRNNAKNASFQKQLRFVNKGGTLKVI